MELTVNYCALSRMHKGVLYSLSVCVSVGQLILYERLNVEYVQVIKLENCCTVLLTFFFRSYTVYSQLFH